MPLSPGSLGTRARAPALIKIRPAERRVPSTSISRGPVNRAWPWMTVQLASERTQFSTPWRALVETASLRAFTVTMSTPTGSLICTPKSAARRT